jgi:formate--tetrahydrofolate ligase
MSAKIKSDIEIARAARKLPILEVGRKLGIPAESLEPYGHDKAKVSSDFIKSLASRPDGRLILVTAINPTPAGEGKTTTTVGLGDALNRIGKRAAICLREPSLGPCFGMKGGAAGGGHAQVVPMEDINLHFTGDFHAITAAHNLLSAMIDNHLYWGNELDLDSRRIVWRRVMDMNDRALREIICSLGGVANGFPREAGFDITVASEIMAILCLSNDIAGLQRRIGDIVIGYRRDKSAVTARDIKADGAMTVLLMKAMQPNLVQTLENNPAFIHGGPFANIAHGCNSVVATRTALKLADYVVTEAGFGADLGAEKFFDIKCRAAGLRPSAAVIVATVRALKMHGGVGKDGLGKENVEAIKKGAANLGRHIDNVKQFGVPVAVAINKFVSDTAEEISAVQEFAQAHGVEAILCEHWAKGSEGTEALAHAVVRLAESGAAQFAPLYDLELPLFEKVTQIVTRIYRAAEAVADKKIRDQLHEWDKAGYGKLPICMAKTQYSFSTDPNLRGAPTHHVVPIREVRLSAGAGFVVVICGEIMTMPGLPKVPAAETIRLDETGLVEGLF